LVPTCHWRSRTCTLRAQVRGRSVGAVVSRLRLSYARAV